MMDFSKLGSLKKKNAPIEPIKLFESLPSLKDTPNDLWRGQAEALSDWHSARTQKDILVSLNTGAGKTIVGILIAQSLVNEGIENVIYVCSTLDLVKQTSAEADRIGIQHTVRTKGSFNNDLFETGKSFCITTYAALFNGYSIFSRKFFPGAVLFDDAHVAESILRDSFTLRIDSVFQPHLFKDIVDIFEPHFKEMGIPHIFRKSLSLGEHATAFAAPRGVHRMAAQIQAILDRHNINQHDNLKFPFAHLVEHIDACAAIFTRGVFELSPPFLPSLALDIFSSRQVRRIYLSATLQSETDFIRAFGRLPSTKIVPSNDAGNGERLIIFGRNVKGGFSPAYIDSTSKKHKIVIAIPNYLMGEKWKSIAEPPNTEEFSEALDVFRKKDRGAFILVSRVDGIDLPQETCRLMLMEGIPGGTSLIERYQWEFLRMNNTHAVRIANRLAQLFGRINRGRNDYGVFLIEEKELNTWLGNDRNVSLLPPLLQKQIMLGREVQSGLTIDNTNSVADAIQKVLGRDEGWLDYYERQIKLGNLDQEQVERVKDIEPIMVEAALSEAAYAAAMWNKDYAKARIAIEETIDRTAAADTPLGGWHSVWLGAAFDLEGDADSACNAYAIARSRLGSAIALPRGQHKKPNEDRILPANSFASRLQSYLGYTHGGKYEKEISNLRQELQLITDGTPRQAEAGVRKLGEVLGFSSLRPDNDSATGPDVIWLDEVNNIIIGFELKTDKCNKKDAITYFKKEIAQGHDHLSWMHNNYPNSNILGLLYIGYNGTADKQSNPNDKMGICTIEAMAKLRDNVLALLDDLRKIPPLERTSEIIKESEKDKWNIAIIKDMLWINDMKC
jgi:hypothetical protein